LRLILIFTPEVIYLGILAVNSTEFR